MEQEIPSHLKKSSFTRISNILFSWVTTLPSMTPVSSPLTPISTTTRLPVSPVPKTTLPKTALPKTTILASTSSVLNTITLSLTTDGSARLAAKEELERKLAAKWFFQDRKFLDYMTSSALSVFKMCTMPFAYIIPAIQYILELCSTATRSMLTFCSMRSVTLISHLGATFVNRTKPLEYVTPAAQTAPYTTWNPLPDFQSRMSKSFKTSIQYHCTMQLTKIAFEIRQSRKLYDADASPVYDWFFPPILNDLCIVQNVEPYSGARFAINFITSSFGFGELLKNDIRCKRCYKVDTGKRRFDYLFAALLFITLLSYFYMFLKYKRAQKAHQALIRQTKGLQTRSRPREATTATPAREETAIQSPEIQEGFQTSEIQEVSSQRSANTQTNVSGEPPIAAAIRAVFPEKPAKETGTKATKRGKPPRTDAASTSSATVI